MVEVIRKKNASLYARLNAAVKTLNGTKLRVGWFETAKYGDGTPVAYVATIHEFGAPKVGIPPRPFMRPTITANEPEWRAFIAQEASKIIAGQATVEATFEALGLNISGEIARSIADVTEPPLKPATIRAKARKMADQKSVGALDKPLVETGLMISSVTHTVGK